MIRYLARSSRACLRKWNYRVTALENGLDAWGVLQQKDAPQMVILDWMMPGLEGIELCRRVRSQHGGRYTITWAATGEKDF